MTFRGLDTFPDFTPKSLALMPNGKILALEDDGLSVTDIKTKVRTTMPLGILNDGVPVEITQVGFVGEEGQWILSGTDLFAKGASSDQFSKISNLGGLAKTIKTGESTVLTYSDHSFSLYFVKSKSAYSKRGLSDIVISGYTSELRGVLLLFEGHDGGTLNRYRINRMELDGKLIKHDTIYVSSVDVLTHVWWVERTILVATNNSVGMRSICTLNRDGSLTCLASLNIHKSLRVQDIHFVSRSDLFYVLTNRTLLTISSKTGIIIQHQELLEDGDLEIKQVIWEEGGKKFALIRKGCVSVGELCFARRINPGDVLNMRRDESLGFSELHVASQILEITSKHRNSEILKHDFMDTFNFTQRNLCASTDPLLFFKIDSQKLGDLERLLSFGTNGTIFACVYMGAYIVGIARLTMMIEPGRFGVKMRMNPPIPDLVICDDSMMDWVFTHLISFSFNMEELQTTVCPSGLFVCNLDTVLLGKLSTFGNVKGESRIEFPRPVTIQGVYPTQWITPGYSRIPEIRLNKKRSRQQTTPDAEVIRTYLRDLGAKLEPCRYKYVACHHYQKQADDQTKMVFMSRERQDTLGAVFDLLVTFCMFDPTKFLDYVTVMLFEDGRVPVRAPQDSNPQPLRFFYYNPLGQFTTKTFRDSEERKTLHRVFKTHLESQRQLLCDVAMEDDYMEAKRTVLNAVDARLLEEISRQDIKCSPLLFALISSWLCLRIVVLRVRDADQSHPEARVEHEIYGPDDGMMKDLWFHRPLPNARFHMCPGDDVDSLVAPTIYLSYSGGIKPRYDVLVYSQLNSERAIFKHCVFEELVSHIPCYAKHARNHCKIYQREPK